MNNRKYLLIADDGGDCCNGCKAALDAKGFETILCRKDGQLLFAHKKSSFVRCRTREEAIFVGWAHRRIRRCTPSCSSGMRNLHRKG